MIRNPVYIEVGRLEGDLLEAGMREVARRAKRRSYTLEAPTPRPGLVCGHPRSATFLDENGVHVCASCTWPSASPLQLEHLAALALEMRQRRGLDEEE